MRSIREGDRVKNYTDQILKYCEVNRVEIPDRFRELPYTNKYAIVLDSNRLHPETYSYDTEIHRVIEEHQLQSYQILKEKLLKRRTGLIFLVIMNISQARSIYILMSTVYSLEH